MSDAARDPAITLFGRKIALTEAGEELDPMVETGYQNKGIIREETNDEANDHRTNNNKVVDHHEDVPLSNLNDGPNDDQQEHALDATAMPNPKPEQDQIETDSSGKEKILKKPDKILPCPRCNSLDTKFCYYNNYNVNQPRHFCKNCQRYWTAGGTMRNVPVGAGRRKNKHSASHYRQLTMTSEGLPSPRVDVSDPVHGQVLPSVQSVPMRSLNANGTVLKFGSESPIEAMVNVLHLGEQKSKGDISPAGFGDNEGEPPCSSSMEVSERVENEHSEKVSPQVEQNDIPVSSSGLPTIHPLPCYPAPPWAYPWNPAWNNVAGRYEPELAYAQDNGNPNPFPWNPPAVLAAPALCTPAIPFPFIPAPFWGCMPTWSGGAWAVPMVGSNILSSTSCISNSSGSSGNNSPKLGKHSRDISMQVEEKPEKSLWIPKTLRIDDPDEAAKSSIWATLGIGLDRNGSVAKGSIFKAFQSKTDNKSHQSEATQVFHANPAALSRSQTFQEST